MATIDQLRAVAVKTLGGQPYPISQKYIEAASQDYKAGQFVYASSGNSISHCETGATACLGMATCDATGTTGTSAEVLLAEPYVVFEANVSHATPASAVTALTQIGAKYGLELSSNKNYCKIDDTTNKFFHVHELSDKDTVGDQYGRVLVRICSDIYNNPGEKTA